MSPLLVLVSPCFRENVVVTCKIVFVCGGEGVWGWFCVWVCVGVCMWGVYMCVGGCVYSLDNLLQKNLNVFFFVNQISKWRSFEKKGYFIF